MGRSRIAVLALLASLAVSLGAPQVGATREPSHAARAHASACRTQPIVFALVEAESPCFEQTAPHQWQSSAAVKFDGISLAPLSGTTVTLTEPTPGAPGGKLSVQTELTEAGVTLARGQLTWTLPAGRAGEEKTLASLATPRGQKLYGLEISGSFAIDLGWDARTNRRYSKLVGNVELPSVFRNGPSQNAGGLTATVALRLDNLQGLQADAIRAQVANAYVGALQIRSLCLSYTTAGSTTPACTPPPGAQRLIACANPGDVNRWDGSAEIVLPTADRPEVGVWAGLQNGAFGYAGGQARQLGNSVPLAQGVFLDKFGLALCLTPPPLQLEGTAGVHFGPAFAGGSAFALDGSLAFINSSPWVLRAEGDISLYGRPSANAMLQYTSSGLIDFGFKAGFDIGNVASIEGQVAGWLAARTPVRFNVVGQGNVCVSRACVQGEVAVSSAGAAGCFTLASLSYPVIVKDRDWVWYEPWKTHIEYRDLQIHGGAGISWSSNTTRLMGDACDIGPYTVARAARIATDDESITVPVDDPVLSLHVHSSGPPPLVVAEAPGGTRYTSVPTGVIETGSFASAPDSTDSSTSLLIVRPQPGTWHVRSQSGPIAGIEEGQAEEPPTILAGVGGSNSDPFSRELGYSYRPDPGHSIVFVEQIGQDERELGPAEGTPCHRPGTPADLLCGRLSFRSAPGPAGPRSIVALVADPQGVAADVLPVADYQAPAEPVPSRTRRMTLRRTNTGLEVDWIPSGTRDPDALPLHYDVDVDLSDGRKLLFVVGATQHGTEIPDVSRDTRATVTVTALRDDQTEGPGDTLTLPPRKRQVSG